MNDYLKVQSGQKYLSIVKYTFFFVVFVKHKKNAQNIISNKLIVSATKEFPSSYISKYKFIKMFK